MKGFLKEHFVLIAGLALPLFLSAAFFFSANFPMNAIDPPRYAAVFVHEYYYRNNPDYPYKVDINEKGYAEFHYYPVTDEKLRNWNLPAVYLYEPKKRKVRRIELPKIPDFKSEATLPIADLEGVKINTSKTSPDGFTFVQDYKGSGNIMTHLFGGGYSGGYRYFFVKESHRFPIEFETSPFYGNGDLIGWVVDEDTP